MSSDNQILVRIYFRTIEDRKQKGKMKVDSNFEGQAFCLRCNDWTVSRQLW